MKEKLLDEGVSTEGLYKYESIKLFPEQSRFKVIYVKAGFAQGGEFIIDQSFAEDGHAEGLYSDLEDLGFFTKTYFVYGDILIDYCFDRGVLNKFKQTVNSDDHTEYHINSARHYGIPESALKSYLEDSGVDDLDLPKSITKHPLFDTIHYKMSKANYLAEWKDYVTKATQAAAMYPELVVAFKLEDLFKTFRGIA